jgi:UDP-N-acetylglucosamine--N-acetylmuramyl-(pentapeptide) pyrophosphoryl-undecaprenol N-acetylglucosamine transferase
MNTVIACGGTGGHLFPGLRCRRGAARARARSAAVHLGEGDRLARRLERTEFRFEKLPSIGLPSPFSPAIVRFTQRFTESVMRSRAIYRKFEPHVVLGMGGLHIDGADPRWPLARHSDLHHESNAIPGKPTA